MIRDVKKGESLGGSREYFKKEYKKFPPTTIEEKISLALFVIATVFGIYKTVLSEFIAGT